MIETTSPSRRSVVARYPWLAGDGLMTRRSRNSTTCKTNTVDPSSPPLSTEPRTIWGRPIAIAAAVLFFLSLGFPVMAGLSKNTASFPKWVGALDVGLAFVLAMLSFALIAITQGKVSRQAADASYRTYRMLTHGILVMILVFFLFGERIVWINCLTGFAWRTWLLLYCLPAWFTALRSAEGP